MEKKEKGKGTTKGAYAASPAEMGKERNGAIFELQHRAFPSWVGSTLFPFSLSPLSPIDLTFLLLSVHQLHAIRS